VTQALADARPAVPIALREFHPFEAAGRRYVYMVPSAGVFRLDDASAAVIDALREGPRLPGEVVEGLSGAFGEDRLRETLEELVAIKAIGAADAPREEVANDLPPEGAIRIHKAAA